MGRRRNGWKDGETEGKTERERGSGAWEGLVHMSNRAHGAPYMHAHARERAPRSRPLICPLLFYTSRSFALRGTALDSRPDDCRFLRSLTIRPTSARRVASPREYAWIVFRRGGRSAGYGWKIECVSGRRTTRNKSCKNGSHAALLIVE